MLDNLRKEMKDIAVKAKKELTEVSEKTNEALSELKRIKLRNDLDDMNNDEFDRYVEKRIEELGLDALRVSKEQIDSYVNQLTYDFTKLAQNHMICIARLGTFNVGQGDSQTISPDNFNADLAREMSMKKAREDAINNLWKMEGYRTYMNQIFTEKG